MEESEACGNCTGWNLKITPEPQQSQKLESDGDSLIKSLMTQHSDQMFQNPYFRVTLSHSFDFANGHHPATQKRDVIGL
jgi:hypothetical protein